MQESRQTANNHESTKEDAYHVNCQQNSLALYTAIYENALMAKECTDVLLGYTDNLEFSDLIRKQVARYDDFVQSCQIEANALGTSIKDKTKTGRTMAKMNAKLKLTANKSLSTMAEMLIQGATMGVIDIKRTLSQSADCLDKSVALAEELLKYEEKVVEEMKYYL
ncbi:MAG: hypothetical protein PHW00_04130 [Clostridia bacterium]|nr:hypothetical protein [Clostridia bacterium]